MQPCGSDRARSCQVDSSKDALHVVGVGRWVWVWGWVKRTVVGVIKASCCQMDSLWRAVCSNVDYVWRGLVRDIS